MLLITVLALLVLIGTCAFSMTIHTTQAEHYGPGAVWNRTFDIGFFDYGSAARQTGDGGFVITGGIGLMSGGDRNALLIKTDGNGSMQWQRLYGGDGFDYGYAVVETAGGGYAMAGITSSSGNGSGDIYLVRSDAEGNVLWEKTFGGSGYDEGRALLQASDGGFVIAGVTESRDNGSDIYLLKTDAAGNAVWERTYGGTYDDLATSVQPTRDGGYIVGGYEGIGKDSGEGYLLKVDAWGRYVWDRRLGGADSVVYQARQTEDRGYVAVGYTNFHSVDSDIYLTRTDHAGNILWQKIFRGNGTLRGYNVFTAPDGGYIIVGEAGPGSRYEGLLLRTDADGNEEWRQMYGADRDVFIRAGTPVRDGGIVLVGSIGDRENVETWDVYLLKTGHL
jgi:hypothetical protein